MRKLLFILAIFPSFAFAMTSSDCGDLSNKITDLQTKKDAYTQGTTRIWNNARHEGGLTIDQANKRAGTVITNRKSGLNLIVSELSIASSRYNRECQQVKVNTNSCDTGMVLSASGLCYRATTTDNQAQVRALQEQVRILTELLAKLLQRT